MVAEATFDPEGMLRALNAHAVRYVVVGGFAVAAHGVIRATADLDLVVDRSWSNATALAAALGDLEAESITEPGMELTADVLARRADRRLLTSHGQLHLLNEVAGVPPYAELAPGAVIDLDGEAIPVCTLDDLLRMKGAAGRDKDRVDLAELEALRAADEESA
jgi:hypothetical protein